MHGIEQKFSANALGLEKCILELGSNFVLSSVGRVHDESRVARHKHVYFVKVMNNPEPASAERAGISIQRMPFTAMIGATAQPQNSRPISTAGTSIRRPES